MLAGNFVTLKGGPGFPFFKLKAFKIATHQVISDPLRPLCRRCVGAVGVVFRLARSVRRRVQEVLH